MNRNFQTSVREERKELAKGAKKSKNLSMVSFCVLRESFAFFAYGCPLSKGGAHGE